MSPTDQQPRKEPICLPLDTTQLIVSVLIINSGTYLMYGGIGGGALVLITSGLLVIILIIRVIGCRQRKSTEIRGECVIITLELKYTILQQIRYSQYYQST